MDASFRKRERQHAFQDDDSDTEMGSIADSKEFGGKRGSFKGQVKQNHSEIEKRRRDKMNTYINELSSMIPMCNAMSRKLDKLTVLRMAVQHMRALRGSSAPVSETNYKPSFLSDEDLKNLVLESADGFLVVVGCDRGRILYVSDSVQKVLSQQQSDLVGQSFFDLLHSKDIATVKDQVSFMEMPPRGDKTSEKESVLCGKNENKQVSKQMCSGARRSFICRMKSGIKPRKSKGNDETNPDLCIMNKKAKLKNNAASEKKKFVMVNFTGYLKSWPPTGIALDDEDDEQESKNLSCLIAVGREVAVADLNTNFSMEKFPSEFVSRHSIDGKFIYLDQRVTSICGYLPQELIGISAYDFFHPHDIGGIAESHKICLEKDASETQPYRFLCKEGHYVYLRSKSSIFRNPWTKELEFIICVNVVDTSRAHPIVQSNITHPRPILPAQDSQAIAAGDGAQQNRRSVSEIMAQDGDQENGAVNSEPAKIGSFIAEVAQGQSNPVKNKQHAILGSPNPAPNTHVSDIMSMTSSNPSSSMTNALDRGQDVSSQGGPMTSLLSGSTAPGGPHISHPHLLEQLIGMQQAIESMESPLQQNEETMAMFMNMLEADAGLGGNLNDILFQ